MIRIASYAAVVLLVTSCAVAAPTAAAPVRLTNSHLIAACVDGKTVTGRTRNWNLAAPATLTLSMRNEPRPGISDAEPGLAAITFTPEEGHRYEVEVHASTTANSQRVWRRGEWTPVVRDRTTDRIVSGEPRWVDAPPCGQN
jgi:hypothetical protein